MPEPSLEIYACIDDACAFHIDPGMPFQYRFHAQHTTSPVRALRPLVTFGLYLICNTIRYTPACVATPSVAICHFMSSRSSFYLFLLPSGFATLPSFGPLIPSFLFLPSFPRSFTVLSSSLLPSSSSFRQSFSFLNLSYSFLGLSSSFLPSSSFCPPLFPQHAHTSAHCGSVPPPKLYINCATLRCGAIIARLGHGLCSALRFWIALCDKVILLSFIYYTFLCGFLFRLERFALCLGVCIILALPFL